MLYNSLIYSHLSYGILLWGSTFQTYLNMIRTMQKRALRYTVHAPYNSPTKPILEEFRILELTNIYKFHLGKYMFLQLNELLPKPLKREYAFNRDIHSHNTRQCDILHKSTRRTVLVGNSFMFKGPDYWNNLPDEIRDCLTIEHFTKKHKFHLLNGQKM